MKHTTVELCACVRAMESSRGRYCKPFAVAVLKLRHLNAHLNAHHPTLVHPSVPHERVNLSGASAAHTRSSASCSVSMDAAYEMRRHESMPNASPGTSATCEKKENGAVRLMLKLGATRPQRTSANDAGLPPHLRLLDQIVAQAVHVRHGPEAHRLHPGPHERAHVCHAPRPVAPAPSADAEREGEREKSERVERGMTQSGDVRVSERNPNDNLTVGWAAAHRA